MSSRWGAVERSARKRVDPSRLARECGIIGVIAAYLDIRRASVLCTASVRWASEARLPLSQENWAKIRAENDEDNGLILVTMKGVQRGRKPSENSHKSDSEARLAAGFAATSNRAIPKPGRGYGRGSRPVKPRSAKSAERLRLRFAPGR
jgi:hypothetical protein